MFLSLVLFSLSLFSPTLLPPLFLSGCLFLSLIHVALVCTLSTVVVVLIHPFVYIRFYLSRFLFFLLCPVSLPPFFSLSVSWFLSRSVLRCKAEETPAVARSFSKVLLSLSRAKNTPAQSSEGVPCQRNTGIRTTKAVNVDLELSWNDFQEWHVTFDGWGTHYLMMQVKLRTSAKLLRMNGIGMLDAVSKPRGDFVAFWRVFFFGKILWTVSPSSLYSIYCSGKSA